MLLAACLFASTATAEDNTYVDIDYSVLLAKTTAQAVYEKRICTDATFRRMYTEMRSPDIPKFYRRGYVRFVLEGKDGWEFPYVLAPDDLAGELLKSPKKGTPVHLCGRLVELKSFRSLASASAGGGGGLLVLEREPAFGTK